MKAKLPAGDWLWPAIWLLPRDNEFGNWPASGEIDLMESRGNDASYPAEGNNMFGSTLHFGPDYTQDAYMKAHESYTLPSGSLADDFHVYGLYWDEDQLYTYIDEDSQRVLEVDFTTQSCWDLGEFPDYFANPWVNEPNSAPFNREYYIIMNVAAGGTNGYFPDGVGGKPWTDASPTAVNDFYSAQSTWYQTW